MVRQERIVIKKSNRIRRFNVYDGIIVAVLSIFALSVLYPFYNAVLGSLVPQQVYIRTPFML